MDSADRRFYSTLGLTFSPLFLFGGWLTLFSIGFPLIGMAALLGLSGAFLGVARWRMALGLIEFLVAAAPLSLILVDVWRGG